ncbi:hypothetical protein Tsubulata_019062 [Turnera subulata]|uniref:Uncharacterized protein n=1 Tax=Turnera subulata TaxID=218843 RepID=A0A9Q0G892_9ROSI|nr:hypothetical protein Tsubulata_019062 [Turnera subulata]
MVCWSAENATKAYIQALKGKRGKDLDEAEFISAIAAGNNAQLMVTVAASAATARSITLPLVAAAHQTKGLVVCILPPTLSNSCAPPPNGLGHYPENVKFVTGDAKTLLMNDYKGADFVAIDCNIDDRVEIFRAAHESASQKRRIVVGYNAFHKGSWASEFNTRFLPIGEGLLVSRISKAVDKADDRKRNKWIVEFDPCTGEEHIYRLS